MLEKIILLIIISILTLFYDGSKLKMAKRREILTYGIALMVFLYLALDYVIGKDWPKPNDIIEFLFEPLAKHIVEFLKTPS